MRFPEANVCDLSYVPPQRIIVKSRLVPSRMNGEMLTLSQETISRFPFLKELSDEALNLIQRDANRSVFAEKANLIFKGDRVSGAYLVEAGALRIYNIDARGKETTLYTVLPGESCLLALNCVFSGLLYPAWVSVDSLPASVLVIPSAAFKRLHGTEEAVRNFTFNVLSARIFDLMSRLEEITSCDLTQRLASYLVRRADNHGEIRISHQEIAAHLGTAREVVSRLLGEFKQNGLINTSRGCITIISVKGLASHGR